MHPLLKDIPLPNRREFYSLVTQHAKKYDEKFLTEKARDDAALNIPDPVSEESSPFERQLVNDTARLASQIVTSYKRALEVLDAKIRGEEESVHAQREHTTLSASEIAAIEEEAASEAHFLKDAHRQLEFAEKRYQGLCDRYNRTPVVYFPHWMYVIFAVLIFIGEVPLNALVFQIFGENQIMTWVMAFIVGLAVPLSAHFIGIKWREHPDGFSWPNFIKGLGALAVIVVALYGLSVMRTTYLGAFQEELGINEAVVRSSMLFFWLNIAVLGAAIFISYLSHDSVPGFQRAERDYQHARRVVAQAEKGRIAAVKKARSQRAQDVKGANSSFREGLSRVNILKGYYDMLLKEGQELESQCQQGLNHDVEIYRRENLRARADKTRPKSFSQALQFEFRLAGMQEKLVNDQRRETGGIE